MSRLLADVVRVATLLSAIATFVFDGGEGAFRFLGLFVLLIGVRVFKLAAPFDLAFCVTMLLAAWAGIQNWYVTVAWMDETVHFFTVGAVASAAYLALSRLEVLPGIPDLPRQRSKLSVLLVVMLTGFGIAAVWEFYEWIAQQFSPKTIHVGYNDTISDLALGGAGALAAGVCILLWSRRTTRR